MDILRYDIKSIRYKGKEKERGLIIRPFGFRGELSRNKSYCYSLSDQTFCTELSHRKNGLQYIPISRVKGGNIYFLFIDEVMYKLKCLKIESGYVDFFVEVSSKKEFSTMSRAGVKKAVTVDLKEIERVFFETVRDKMIFKKYVKKIGNNIVFRSEHIQHYKFRKCLSKAGFKWDSEYKSWVLN